MKLALGIMLLVLILVAFPFTHTKAYHSYSVKKVIKPIPTCKVLKLANGTVVKNTYHETEGNVTAHAHNCA